MKLKKLQITNFNSFTTMQEIDFETAGKDGIFCITGNTGSGKSTIFDAIIFALFGECTRGSRMEEMINLSQKKATIKLEFCGTYKGEYSDFLVERSISRKSSASTAQLYRIDEVGMMPLASNTTETANILSNIIGLNESDFTQCILLEQGKFARFLSANGVKRRQIVERLFHLEKYGDKLKKKVSEDDNILKNELNVLRGKLEEYIGISGEELAQKRKQKIEKEKAKIELTARLNSVSISLRELAKERDNFKATVRLNEALRVTEGELEALGDRLTALMSQQDEIIASKTHIDELNKIIEDRRKKLANFAEVDGVISSVELEEKSQQLLREKYREIADNIAKNKENLLALTASIEERKMALNASPAFGKVEGWDAEVESNLWAVKRGGLEADSRSEEQAKKRKAELVAKQKIKLDSKASLLANIEILHGVISETEKKSEQKRKDISAIDRELLRLERDKALSVVLSTVEVGDLCPICGDEVLSKRTIDVTQYDKVRASREETAEELTKLEQKLNEGKSAYSNTLSTLASLEVSLSELVEEIEKIKIEDSSKKLIEAQKICDDLGLIVRLKQEANNSENVIKDGEGQKETIVEKGKASSSELKRLLAEKERLVGGEDIRGLKARFTEELDKAVEEQRCLMKLVADNEAELKTTNLEIASREGRRKSLVDELKASVAKEVSDESVEALEREEASVKAERETLSADIGGLNAQIESDRLRYEMKKELEADEKRVKLKRDKVQQLFSLVAENKFAEFISEEYILEFTALASEILSEMTNYSLRYTGDDFVIRDFCNDNLERKASTLSGGQTFLASLALAIAISRIISETSRFEFFFLDEGFGTLDKTSIEIVTRSLTNLAKSSHIMVGIVSHSEDLIEQISSRIEVTSATPTSGSVISLSVQ